MHYTEALNETWENMHIHLGKMQKAIAFPMLKRYNIANDFHKIYIYKGETMKAFDEPTAHLIAFSPRDIITTSESEPAPTVKPETPVDPRLPMDDFD